MRAISLHDHKVASEPVIGLAAVFLLYGASVLIVGIGGNFPLNDDWSYAAAVRGLVFGHDWRPSGWTSATVITQSLWAAPFCGIDRCDYVSLRLSSLVAAAISLFLCHRLFSRFGVGAWFQSIGLAVIAFNPLSFALQFTFMTETVFTMFLLASLLSFTRFIEDGDRRYYVAGCLLAVCATLCRQLGLCVPIAFALAWLLFQRNGRLARTLSIAAFPTVASAAILFLYNEWMHRTGRTPALYDAKNDLVADALANPHYLVQRVAWNFSACMLYLGFFTAPLTLGRICPSSARPRDRRTLIPIAAAALSGLLFIGVMIIRGALMPISGNILTSAGIGPMLVYEARFDHPPLLPVAFWIVVTLISLAGAMRILYIASDFIVRLNDRTVKELGSTRTMTALLLILSMAAYFVPISSINFYDRYVMPLIPIMCAFLLLVTRPPTRPRGGARLLAGVLCGMTVGFSVLATHDYMNWNRARWHAIADLENLDHQNAHNIDGGMEYNSALYDPDYKRVAGKSSYWVDNDTYKVTFVPLSDETIVRRYEYPNYLPPAERFIYVMKKE